MCAKILDKIHFSRYYSIIVLFQNLFMKNIRPNENVELLYLSGMTKQKKSDYIGAISSLARSSNDRCP